MIGYTLNRFGQLVIVLLVVSVIIFTLFHVLIPGDPALAMLGMEYTEEAYQILRREMGLDSPLVVQYARWIAGTLRGDLGISITDHVPVNRLVLKRLSVTIVLATIAMSISSILAVVISMYSAYHRNSWMDYVVRTLSISGICMPTQWLAILLMLIVAVYWRLLPSGGYVSISEGVAAAIPYLILPVVTLTLQQTAILVRFLRSNILDVLNEDFIRTARSKGLRELVVLSKHALRNSVVPFVTLMGISFARMVGGMVIVERVFNIPGLGRLLVRAVSNRDYPVIQASVLVAAGLYVVINFVVDLSYVWIDPRIRYGRKAEV